MSVRKLIVVCSCGYEDQIGAFKPNCPKCESGNGGTFRWESQDATAYEPRTVATQNGRGLVVRAAYNESS